MFKWLTENQQYWICTEYLLNILILLNILQALFILTKILLGRFSVLPIFIEKKTEALRGY